MLSVPRPLQSIELNRSSCVLRSSVPDCSEPDVLPRSIVVDPWLVVVVVAEVGAAPLQLPLT